MKDLMKDIFPFDEDNVIELKLRLYSHGHNRSSITLYAAIQFNGSDITLNTSLENKIKRNMPNMFKKKDISIEKATVRGMQIEVTKQDLFFQRYTTNGNSTICSANLNSLSYIIGNSDAHYYRLSENAKFLKGYLSQLVVKNDLVVGVEPCKHSFSIYNSNKYVLFQFAGKVFMKTENGSDPKLFLTIASFFSCSPIEILMYNNNGQVCLNKSQYKICLNRKVDNQHLTYLFCNGKCLDYFTDFLEQLSNISKPSDFDILRLYIEYYVRAEYLDDISKLILYTSILAKFSNVEKGQDTDKAISHFLKSNNLSFEKINCSITGENIKTSEGKPIDNFVKLRNFIIHQLGNQKAENFLRTSNMLFNLKMAITIIILKKLGISDVHFDKNFHKISIFDDSYPESESLKNLFTR